MAVNSTNSTNPTPAPPAPTPAPQAATAKKNAPKMGQDKLVRGKSPAAPADPKPVAVVKSEAEAKTNININFRLGGLATFFGTGLTTWLFNPQMVVNHIQTLSGHIYHFVAGTKNLHEFNKGLVQAKKAGTVGEYLQSAKTKLGSWIGSGVTMTRDKVRSLFVKGVAAPVVAPVATAGEVNRGLIGWIAEARAQGANPIQALVKGFSKTLATGGDMPVIAARVENTGTWGKALFTTAKIARVAPLLNLPIAIFDIVHARQVTTDPNASGRLRAAKIGQAVLSSSAAVLSIAAFLLPAPLDIAALAYASYAGLGSVGWSLLSSKAVVNFFKKTENFLHLGPHHSLES